MPIARFAALNRLSIDAATREFENDALTLRQVVLGRELAVESSEHRVPVLHFENTFAIWMSRHALGENTGWPYVAHITSRMAPALIKLTGILDRSTHAAIDAQVLAERYDELIDHVRPWSSRHGSPRVLAGFSTAPYLSWDNPKITRFVAYVRSLGLDARVGLAQDQWYNGATVPITVWNPLRVDLT
jgi:hypothetical protein